MEPTPVMRKCDVCGTTFQYGPHRYDGHVNSTYHILVCRGCWNANHDGWAAHLEEKVTAKLKEGLPLPTRNAKGWLPRD